MSVHAFLVSLVVSSWWVLAPGTSESAEPLTPANAAVCKKAVINAYEQLSKQAAAIAHQANPAAYRLLAETRFRTPGKKQESAVSRLITVAVQRENAYYTDGTHDVYSNATERVIIDRQKHAILIIDNQGHAADEGGYATSIQLIRSQLLEAAKVSDCSSQLVNGKVYKKVTFTLPASVQLRTHVVTLASLLTAQNSVYQTTMSFATSEPVRQVSFTLLPVTGAAAAIRTVAPPLSYVYHSDHSVQNEFARFQITDQRKKAH